MTNKNKNTLESRKRDHGFTIIELMIVISIAGILISIAGPRFFAWRNSLAVKSAARDLYSALQEARMLAIKQNSPTAIVFGANCYYVCDDFGGDGNWATTGDNNIIRATCFSTYGHDVGYSDGTTIGGKPLPPDVGFPGDGIDCLNNFLSFNARGFSGNGRGFVYIQRNPDGRVFAVGMLASGAVKLAKFGEGGWQ